ncbi:hypothetical protein ACOSP7_029868 [Xanthoceras sorbifolium]
MSENALGKMATRSVKPSTMNKENLRSCIFPSKIAKLFGQDRKKIVKVVFLNGTWRTIKRKKYIMIHKRNHGISIRRPQKLFANRSTVILSKERSYNILPILLYTFLHSELHLFVFSILAV